MTATPFFTDPLAAAFMSKRYGLRLGTNQPNGFYEWGDYSWCFHNDGAYDPYTGNIYLHPDSIPLLEAIPHEDQRALRRFNLWPVTE